MSFFNHTAAWIKGELFEAAIIMTFGTSTMLGGFLFWKFGTTPNAKAMLVPLVVAGIIYAAIGLSMTVSNQKRMIAYEQNHNRDKEAFILSEKKRVENFQYGYTVSKIVATVCFPLTLLLFWFTKDSNLQGIGIGLTLFALSGLVVDYFSKERADIYYNSILNTLK